MRMSTAMILAAALAAGGLAGCSPKPPGAPPQQAAVLPPPPTPLPPTQAAPLCVKPPEKDAFDVSALRNQLVLTALTCKTEDRYNAVITKYRSDLSGSEKVLDGYFGRAYGKRGQSRQDDYNTQLISAQSLLAGRAGSLYCQIYSPMFEEVMALPSGRELPTYAAGKSIQRALAVTECPAPSASAAKAAPAAKKKP